MKHTIEMRVNGSLVSLEVEARMTLADALRDLLRLTGTHLGCEQGVCGACTVIADGAPIRSCLTLAVQCDGWEITTIEGIADGDELHPVQRAFHEHHALQCGFCTPGFITLAIAELSRDPQLDDDQLLEIASSNLCRCTGYLPIIEALRSAANELAGSKHPDTA
jgi:aerobic carbon-monoxide dehydrogenase small subunit